MRQPCSRKIEGLSTIPFARNPASIQGTKLLLKVFQAIIIMSNDGRASKEAAMSCGVLTGHKLARQTIYTRILPTTYYV